MRILFVSNFYPPVIHGGYEQLCREVALGLTARGHELAVLTSKGREPHDGPDTREGGVRVLRYLHLEVEGGVLHTTRRLLRDRGRLERENVHNLQEILSRFRPEAVMIWGMWNLPRSVPAALETFCGDRLAYYICDYWPSLPNAYVQHWKEPSRRVLTATAKRLIGHVCLQLLLQEAPATLNFPNAFCVSRRARDLLVDYGVPVAHAGVIYGNASIEQFSERRHPRHDDVLRLLYSGRISREKGVHTAIRALAALSPEHRSKVQLDIFGKGAGEYERDLRQLVHGYGLGKHVRFCGGVPRANMPSVLARHDVLLFPSEWEEPFARSVLEAMAAGLVVIGSTAGGTPEVLFNNQTGLTFSPGDAAILGKHIATLIDEPGTRARLSDAARKHVSTHFTFTHTVDEIESALSALARRADITMSRQHSPAPTSLELATRHR